MWRAGGATPPAETHGAQHWSLCWGISFLFTPGSLKTGWGRGERSLPLSLGFFAFLGYKYEGVKFEKGNCGVSIMRSGRQLLVVEWV